MGGRVFFMPSPAGQRLCIYHPAQGARALGRVIYIHPLAEEMNKTRRMAALQSCALAAQGYAVLQVDLLGCGDSSGDFGDARWEAWLNDIARAAAWLRLQTASDAPRANHTPLWLWGLRAGCLLALQAASRLDEPCHFLFWQPPWSGHVLLQQFLRLQLAANLLGKATPSKQDTPDTLREQLQQGHAVEVAGYMLSPDVARGLERALLEAPHPAAHPLRVEWLEVSALSPPGLSPMPEALRAGWSHPELQLQRLAVAGPAFWQSSNGEVVPQLLEATTAALASPGP